MMAMPHCTVVGLVFRLWRRGLLFSTIPSPLVPNDMTSPHTSVFDFALAVVKSAVNRAPRPDYAGVSSRALQIHTIAQVRLNVLPHLCESPHTRGRAVKHISLEQALGGWLPMQWLVWRLPWLLYLSRLWATCSRYLGALAEYSDTCPINALGFRILQSIKKFGKKRLRQSRLRRWWGKRSDWRKVAEYRDKLRQHFTTIGVRYACLRLSV